MEVEVLLVAKHELGRLFELYVFIVIHDDGLLKCKNKDKSEWVVQFVRKIFSICVRFFIAWGKALCCFEPCQ